MARVEQSRFDVPPSRSVSSAYNTGNTWNWVFGTPPGKQLQGFLIDALVTTVGAGMATSTMANILQTFQAQNEKNIQTLDVDKYTIDEACAVGAAMAWSNGYNDIPRTTSLVRDPANVATGGSFYASWRLHAPLPGNKHIVTIVTPGILATWAGATGGSIAMFVVPIWADIIFDGVQRKQYTLYAKQTATNTRFNYNGVEIIALIAAVEWTTIASGIDIGGTMSYDQILEYESIANDLMRGFLVDGTSTATHSKVLVDPFTGSDAFVLAKKVDDSVVANITVNTSTTVKTVVYGQRDVREVPLIG